MELKADRGPTEARDAQAGEALILELWALRKSMLERQAKLEPWLRDVEPAHRASAINLMHYLAMRGMDLRDLQERLALIGVSSLGRAETHVLANVDKVLGILHLLVGRPWVSLKQDEPAGQHSGAARLTIHAEALFGAPPPERNVRIMVTLPSEAAVDDLLVESLVAAGMNIARINCAHDDAAEWVAMAKRVHRADGRRHGGHQAQTRARCLGPRQAEGVLLECEQTAYLTGETCLRLHHRSHGVHETRLGDIPVSPGQLHLGLILKIETRRGFEHLPEMLLAAMVGTSAGVMIARGDLAVECGYERMAEVQEEILWACEAAHMPVVWATQVLETLAKTGLPSRAEITDAAMGGRAECVMLNKGPHILDAMRTSPKSGLCYAR